MPITLTSIPLFHGLASFYRRFISRFSTVMAHISDLIKIRSFAWTPAAHIAFETIKKLHTSALVLALPDCSQVYEVTCIARNSGIGATLNENGHPIGYFHEKLKQAQLNYSIYDAELYVVIRALDHWRHHLLHRDFIIHSDHEVLQFLNINDRHVRFANVLHLFSSTLCHKEG